MNISPYYILLAVIGVVVIGGYLWGTFRKSSNEASAASNQILRGLIDDQRKEIDNLKTTVAHQATQIKELQGQVQTNAEIRLLVADALKVYFTENPDKAKELISKVKIA